MPQNIYALICHSANPGGGIGISHVVKVIETTTDQYNAIYRNELEALYQSGAYNPHILVLDRPANLDFLQKLADGAKGEESHA